MAKKRITISVNEELLDWMDIQTKKGTFFNRSHCFEYCTKYVKDNKLGILGK